jgi:hypothetical protein
VVEEGASMRELPLAEALDDRIGRTGIGLMEALAGRQEPKTVAESYASGLFSAVAQSH